ncbi:MAG: SPOR domain-containing protein [Planctomycetes bacterium]|nr:SPOR domain-containing protein [Planctomycetota bacterium]
MRPGQWIPGAFALACFCSCKTPPPPIAPRDSAAGMSEAYRHYLGGQYRQALESLRPWLQLPAGSPGVAEAAFWAGFCHLKLGDYVLAEKRFQTAVGGLGQPNFLGPAFVGLADSEMAQGHYREAVSHYERALQQFGAYVDRVRAEARASEAREHLPDAGKTSPQARGGVSTAQRPARDSAHATGDRSRPYSVQVGAFAERSSARKLVEQIGRDGFPAYIKRIPEQAKRLYLVRVGHYRSREEAIGVQKQLKSMGFDTLIVP